MRVKRLLGRYTQEQDGPLFLGLGGIHGNEHAGILAFLRVFEYLEKHNPPFRGEFIGVAGNLPAIEQKRRFIDLDLNRQWTDEKIAAIDGKSRRKIISNEALQQKELLILFKRILKTSKCKPVVLLDMHTTSAEGGIPFSIANDTPLSRSLAMNLEAPAILGVDKVTSGTTLNYFGKLGMCAFGFEAGQHDNPVSIDKMEAALWLTLEKLGCIERAKIPDYEEHFSLLHNLSTNMPSLVEFIYRHAIEEGANFIMQPGFKNFQKITKGQLLATDINGPILAEKDGMILMPLYQKLGEDGFFVIKPVNEEVEA